MKKNIEGRLKAAFTDQIPNCLDSVLQDIGKEKGEKIIMAEKKETKKNNTFRKRYGILAASLAIIVMGGLIGILGHNIGEANDDIKEFAEKFGLSIGKSQYIFDICQARPQYKPEDLAGLTINELNMLTENHKDKIPSVDFTGNASHKNYLSDEKAIELAMSYAGLTKEQIKFTDLDFESEKISGETKMVYEVEFKTDTEEYEIELDAITGELLKTENEPIDLDNEQDIEDNDDTEDTEDDNAEDAESNDDIVDDDTDDDDIDEGDTDDDDTIPEDAVLTEKEAIAKALESVSVSEEEAKNISSELENERGTNYFEVEFESDSFSYEILIETSTGKIALIKKESTKIEKKDPITLNVDESQAKEISLSHFGLTENGITEYEIEEDNGIYEIEFSKDGVSYECIINAVTGKILNSEKEEED